MNIRSLGFRWRPVAWRLVGMVCIVGFVWYSSIALVAVSAQERRTATHADYSRELTQRFETYADSLYAIEGLVLASENVDQTDWETFLGALRAIDRYPGVEALALARMVQPAHKDLFVRHMNGLLTEAGRPPDFSIKQIASLGSAILPVQFSFNSRWERTQPGYDLSGDAESSAAIAKALATGRPAASGQFRLPGGGYNGFLVVRLFGFSDDFSRQVGEAESRGLAAMFFNSYQLIEKTIGKSAHDRGIELDVTDVTDPARPQLVYGSVTKKHNPNDIVRLSVADRSWEIRFVPADDVTLLEAIVPLLAAMMALLIMAPWEQLRLLVAAPQQGAKRRE